MKGFKLVYSLVFIASFAAATAQTSGQSATAYGDGRTVSARKETAGATQGTQYINEKYMPAKVSNKDMPVMVRYNAYNDYFEFTTPENQAAQTLAKEQGVTITFNMNGQQYALVKYKTDKDEVVDGYLTVISDGPKVKIYKRERIYFQPEREAANSYQPAKAAAYKRADDEYYVKVGDAEAVFFDGKKEFAKLIPGKNKEVLDYIKDNKLDVEKDTDLVKVASYIQTLI